MTSKVAEGLELLFKCRGSFMVIGLTGRTGSGCSSAASILGKKKNEFLLPSINTPPQDVHDRKDAIIRQWFDQNWHPFTKISVSDIIVSFILGEEPEKFWELLKEDGSKRTAQIDGLLVEIANAKSEYADVLDTKQRPSDDPATALRTRNFVTSFLPDFTKTLRAVIGRDDIKILQKLGDNLRKSGTCYSATTTVNRLFAIPNRIRLLIDRCRQANESDGRQDYFVIDALRNPFEVLYFKERFAPFYLMAISSPDDDRRTRLANKNYTKAQIDAFDKKEYPEINKPLSGYEAFVSQNIQSCIERADIHINNQGTVEALEHTPDLKTLAGYLVKYVSLIQHPGLVTPTRVERCMQAAYVAKLNSGCISRQVGAVVTDENYSIKSVGWNDVPLGQVPCLLRKAETIILEHDDKEAFSDYERKTSKFKEHIRKTFTEINAPQLKGRNVSFCFKDAYNSIHKSDNQVHTRSLHAEENAFLQISKHGGLGLQGGALFSTASPCELCAKKAYQIGIKTIHYIDPYPGISLTHILASGTHTHRPKMELFVGAIGEAYHRLYTPILPYKDELTALLKKDDPPE